MDKQILVAQWYDDYGESIFKYILMMVKDYQDAEDLTQETFVKAIRKYHTFSNRSSIKTWLFRIAQNTTLDYLRKKKPLFLFWNPEIEVNDRRPLPYEFVSVHEEYEELFQAIQNLKPNYRQVIILRKLKAFSTKETADILGWSESKVKSTLHRALLELKKQLIKGGFKYEAIQS